jgi:predicted permease
MIDRLRESLARLRGAIRPGRRDEDLQEELRSHLEMAAEAEARRGAAPDAAARAAVVRAGAMRPALEAVRDQRGLPWVDDFTHDLRYSLRALRATPTFTLAVLVTLAIGIGATTAIFTVVNRVLIQPLRYPDAGSLVAVWHTAPGAPGVASVSGDLRASISMYFSYAEHNRTFQHIGLWSPWSAAVTGDGQPEQIRVALVTDGTLQALGVAPVLGRPLSAADQIPNAPPVIILGHGFWQRRFGGDPGIVGRSVVVDSLSREVVGVMPRGFRVVTVDPDVIMPLMPDRATTRLSGFGFEAVARLKPGATIADASADISRMLPIWLGSWPAFPGVDPRIYEEWRIAPALRPLKDDVVGGVRTTLWVVMGTIAGVLLVACANVANLLLVRGEGRRQELAVRAALGAGRGRIARGLIVESLVLAVAGATLGLAFANAQLRLLPALAPGVMPRLDEVALDAQSVGFAMSLAVVAGILFGLVSAPKRAVLQLGAGARAATVSRSRHRARQGLVLVQLALAMILLVLSGLMVRTFVAMTRVDPGFSQPEQVLTARISVPATLEKDPIRVARLQQAILENLAAIPGVSSAGLTSRLPMEASAPNWDSVMAEDRSYGQKEIPPFRLFKSISPGYLRTAGTRVIAGRDYDWTDLYESRRVVMVSENLARELWGTPSAALGRRVRTVVPGAPWREVIGVVQDVHDNGVHVPPPATVYWPSFGESTYRAEQTTVERFVTVALRSEQAETEALANSAHQAVWAANPNLPLAFVRTLGDVYDRSMERTSFALVMLSLAACMSMLLGFVGVYAVISYAVAQRTREIGIRMALGAQPREVTRMFVRHGVVIAGIGIAIGLAVAAATARSMAAILFGIGPLDPMTYALLPVALLAATIVATFVPARRAAAVDPAQALRT